jgi:hypothetical protein
VFDRHQGGADNWGQVAKLVASDGAVGDSFGRSVAISEDIVVVGAYNDDDKGISSGSAYVFERNQGGADHWGQVVKLTASDGVADASFGRSVAISGDTVIVGALFDDDNGTKSGSAYVFERNQGGADHWGQAAKLTASDGAADDHFGRSVAISEDTIVAGAGGDGDKGTDSGSAYVYQMSSIYHVYLPLELYNYSPPATFPLLVGDAIPQRPVTHPGEVFYSQPVRIPATLPPGGHFYFSAQQDAVAEVLVDDLLAIRLGNTDVFTHDFASGGSPEPAIVEVPRTKMEGCARQTVVVEYRDVYGDVVEASEVWLIWAP